MRANVRDPLGTHAMFSRAGVGSVTFQSQARRGVRHASDEAFSIKSATVAGIAPSALLGLAGVTLTPAPANAVVYCQYKAYPGGALPAQASCLGHVL